MVAFLADGIIPQTGQSNGNDVIPGDGTNILEGGVIVDEGLKELGALGF